MSIGRTKKQRKRRKIFHPWMVYSAIQALLRALVFTGILWLGLALVVGWLNTEAQPGQAGIASLDGPWQLALLVVSLAGAFLTLLAIVVAIKWHAKSTGLLLAAALVFFLAQAANLGLASEAILSLEDKPVLTGDLADWELTFSDHEAVLSSPEGISWHGPTAAGARWTAGPIRVQVLADRPLMVLSRDPGRIGYPIVFILAFLAQVAYLFSHPGHPSVVDVNKWYEKDL